MIIGPVRRDADTVEFLDGTRHGVFLMRECVNCGAVGEPQVGQCPSCAGTVMTSREAGGGATVVSWSVLYGRPGEGHEPERTVLAIGQLDEGPWWWSQVVDADPDAMAVGVPLRIDFASAGDEMVPVFRLR